jgi:hypothetical protein
MRLLGFLVVLAVVLPKELMAQEHHRILEQDGAPVTIRKYDPEPWVLGAEYNDGVRHEVRFRNDTDRMVVAVKFGALCYNIFNEFQEGSEGIVVKDVLPGKRVNHIVWTYLDDPPSFFSGLIYVAKVRFLDGEVWEADPDDLDAQILAFETGLKGWERDRESRGG